MTLTLAEAKKIIARQDHRSERYWQGDPSLVAEVTEAFAKAYPGELLSDEIGGLKGN